jgi:hypothetical protein
MSIAITRFPPGVVTLPDGDGGSQQPGPPPIFPLKSSLPARTAAVDPPMAGLHTESDAQQVPEVLK